MKSKKFLIFIVLFPAIEIFLFVENGATIGSMMTILVTITTALIGVYLLRNWFINQFSSIQSKLMQGLSVSDSIKTALSHTISGIFLIIPGFFTDFLGLLLFFEFFRDIVITSMLSSSQFHRSTKNQKNVIDVEKVDDD